MPAGASRDNAVDGFVNAAAADEPGLAWDWALTLSDPNDQKKALRVAAREWLRANDAQARQAIQSSGLLAALIRELLQGNQPGMGSPGRPQAFLFAFSVFCRRP